jgi:hypothetical protein
MRHREGVTEAEIRDLCQTLVERGQIMVKGVEVLRLLRRAIERAHQRAGVVVEWDPSSAVDLREWFGVTSLSSVRYAIAGSAMGLLLFGLTNRAGWGTAVGAGIGALVGAVHGHQAVRSGWRLRSYLDERGTVCVEVKVLPGPTR